MEGRLIRCAVSAALMLLCAQALAQWKVSTDTDKMSGAKITTATVDSQDSLRLEPPYAGMNKGRLVVREHPRHGLDVIFIVQKGQILCRISGCDLLVRFDEEEPETFRGSPSADHSTNIVFLGGAERFINAAKTAKRIQVQATYFRSGQQILTFKAPKGLDWK